VEEFNEMIERKFESLLLQRKVQKEVNRNRSGGKRRARRRKRVLSGFFMSMSGVIRAG
jgi:hypothetical protein